MGFIYLIDLEKQIEREIFITEKDVLRLTKLKINRKQFNKISKDFGE